MLKQLVDLAFPPSQLGRALWITFAALAILAAVWVLHRSAIARASCA